MKIGKLKANHIENPVGYALGQPVLSWVVTESSGKRQKAARVRLALDSAMEQILFDSGMTEGSCSAARQLTIPANVVK